MLALALANKKAVRSQIIHALFYKDQISQVNIISCILVLVIIPYEQVVEELAADTLDQASCLGLKGYRFMPEEFPQLACVSLKVGKKLPFPLNLEEFLPVP